MLRFLHLGLLVTVFAIGSAFAQLSLSIDVDQPSCNGYTDAKITVNPSGGDAPYDYQWTDGNTNRGRYSVVAGSYTVTVTDNAGATATETVQIVEPAVLALSINIDGDACNQTGAAYDLVAVGGTAPYQFTWDGNSVSNRVSNPSKGYHHAVVTDANGCSTNTGIQISAPLAVTVKTTNVACFGFCDGTVEAKVEDGNGPYTFLWSNGATDQLVYNLDPGTYTVTVTDQDGCTAMASGTLTEPDPISFTVSLQDSCAGATTAFVNNIQGGTGNTTVRWSTGTIGNSAYLTEGQHYVIVEDENGCETTERVIVSDGVQSVTYMNVDATCDSLGSALLCITGGRGPFTYLWSNGQTGIQAVNLVPGVYTYSITDGAGCTASGATLINGPSPADCTNCDAEAGTLTGGPGTEEDCTDVTLTATIGTAPVVPAGYQIVYVLTNASSGVILQTNTSPTFVIPMGGAGSYTIHTLVYDPTTLDLSTVVLNSTMAGDIFLQLIAGGGTICAALDVTGTTFIIASCFVPSGCDDGAEAGSLAGSDVCFDGTSSMLTPSVVSPANVPTGYIQLFLLISVPGDTILATSTSPNFMVGAEGTYLIRSYVYNSDSLDVNTIIFPGETTGAELEAILTTCESFGAGASFNVTLFDPAFPAALSNEPCPEDTVELNPGGDDSYSYAWSPANLLDDPTAVSPNATVSATTTFNVLITQVVNGESCTVARTYQVNVSALPTLDAPANITTCDGGTVDLQVSNVNGSDIIWSSDSEFTDIVGRDSTLTVTSGASATYYVRATNSNGCFVTDEVTVGDFPVEVALAADYTICQGESTVLQTQLVGGNATAFSLMDSQGNVLGTSTTGIFEFTPPSTDEYAVVGTNAQGCSDTASIAIDISEVDASLLTELMATDTMIYPGNEVVIFAGTSSSSGMYVFDEDNTYLNVNNNEATVMPDTTTTYTVTVTDEFGCDATATLVVEVLDFVCDEPFLFVPNAFSPDGDMINDIYFVDGVNVDECYYAIFNRWGEQVYESFQIGNENGIGWDGTFNGIPVDPDVYGLYVRILCNDGGEFYRQGNVTVIR